MIASINAAAVVLNMTLFAPFIPCIVGVSPFNLCACGGRSQHELFAKLEGNHYNNLIHTFLLIEINVL
jgi:hypothetical protein